MLVVCFSWSGTTEKAAQMIAKSTGADLFRIEPTEDYPTSYKALTDIVKKKLADGKIRTVKSAPPPTLRNTTRFLSACLSGATLRPR